MKIGLQQAFVLPAVLLPAILASVMVTAVAQTPPLLETLVLTATNNGTTVVALLEQPIPINLPDNPSTGYGWYLADANGTSVISNGPSLFTPDSPGTVGGGGTISLPYLAVSPGPTTLSLAYYQRWDPQDIEAKYAVTINVTPMPPALSLTLNGDNVVMTWPTNNSSGFFLEGTASLQAAQWAALNVIPLADGQNYRVTLGRPGSALYFRLHKL